MMSSSNCIYVILNIIKSPELLFYHDEETGRAAIAEDRMGFVT